VNRLRDAMMYAKEQPVQAAEYVTVMIGSQMFGLPISRVQDVFTLNQMTRVPLAPDDIAGVINLRGRIVTAIDMRRRLGLGPRSGAATLAVGIDCDGESYGLVIDSVGEVLRLSADSVEPVPVNLDEQLKCVASCVHRLEDELLVVLDVDRLLDVRPADQAA
jgi:purine-binding chemotaxis protein CheW